MPGLAAKATTGGCGREPQRWRAQWAHAARLNRQTETCTYVAACARYANRRPYRDTRQILPTSGVWRPRPWSRPGPCSIAARSWPVVWRNGNENEFKNRSHVIAYHDSSTTALLKHIMQSTAKQQVAAHIPMGRPRKTGSSPDSGWSTCPTSAAGHYPWPPNRPP